MDLCRVVGIKCAKFASYRDCDNKCTGCNNNDCNNWNGIFLPLYQLCSSLIRTHLFQLQPSPSQPPAFVSSQRYNLTSCSYKAPVLSCNDDLYDYHFGNTFKLFTSSPD